MKTTFTTFAIGTMALAGVPFVFSGFWSKEAILHAAHEWHVSHIPMVIGLIAVVLTAFYMTRLVCEAFFGHARTEAAEHAHESPAVMTVPLAILAVCSIALGFLGTPAWPWLQSMLTGKHVHPHSIFEGAGLMFLSIALVGVGIGASWLIYGKRPRKSVSSRDPLEAAAPGLNRVLADRLRFDELYAATVGKLSFAFAWAADALDRYVWGGLVNFLGLLGEFAGLVSRESDEDAINGGFDAGSETLRRSGQVYSRSQTGDAQSYLRTLAVGFILLVLIVTLGGLR
jgi:NADH-quinone oxidoreductase subunit L